MTNRPRILLACSTNWIWPGELAGSFASAGIEVAATAPPDTPLLQAVPDAHRHKLSRVTPLRSLARAIEASGADAVIACDDRVVWQLKRLYLGRERYGKAAGRIAAIVERSIGPAIASEPFLSRTALLDLAREEGVAIPEGMSLRSAADLSLWEARAGYPAYVKADGTFAGRGVTEVADRAAAERAIAWQRSPARLGKEVAKLLLGRDGAEFWDWVQRRERSISIQAAVPGRPANILVACDRGSVLASTGVFVQETVYRNGPAQSIRIVQNAEMVDAATRIVRHLGLSGFVGFDFMISAATGQAFLIEMNPRATGLARFAPVGADDPVASYCKAILSVDIAPRPAASFGVIALAGAAPKVPFARRRVAAKAA
jgi:hypothetical protein